MPNRPITIVFGAGASYQFGYPLGGGLIERIISSLGQEKTRQLYFYNYFDPSLLDSFRADLIRGMPNSIDEFLEGRHKEYGELGKFAIGYELRIVETSTIEHLFQRTNRVNGIDEANCYHYIISQLNRKDIENFLNDIYFISFNYDLSFEHFIYRSTVRYGSLKEENVRDILRKKLNIVHVHGSLGALRWQKPNGRIYGENLLKDKPKLVQQISNISQEIKLIFEAEQEQTFKKAQEYINASDIVFFLGFGYHHDNLRRIGILDAKFANKIICGTTLGYTRSEIRHQIINPLKIKNRRHPSTHISVDNEGFMNIVDFLRNSDRFNSLFN